MEPDEIEEEDGPSCPNCGYSPVEVVPRPYEIENRPDPDQGKKMVAVLPVAICPICNEETPLVTPEQASEDVRRIERDHRESLDRVDEVIKRSMQSFNFSLIAYGFLIGFSTLQMFQAIFMFRFGGPAYYNLACGAILLMVGTALIIRLRRRIAVLFSLVRFAEVKSDARREHAREAKKNISAND